jgi:hypothetical protein
MSKAGGVKVTLDGGPKGMTAADGVLTWDVPKDFAEPSAFIILTLTDGTGRQKIITFTLPVRDPPVGRLTHPADSFRAPSAAMLTTLLLAPPTGVEPVKDQPDKHQPTGPKVVKLPAPATRWVVGADGRLILLHLPKLRLIAAFDLKDGKVIKYLPAPDEDILLAAGRTHLFVVRNATGTMQRWNLVTFEKESTVKIPADGPFTAACMGCASTGPLLLCAAGNHTNGSKLTLLDPITVRELPGIGLATAVGYGVVLRADPDGDVFTWQTPHNSVAVLRAIDGKFGVKTFTGSESDLQPGPRGRFFYSPARVYDEQLRPVHPKAGPARTNRIAAAVHGNLFLDLELGPAPKTQFNDPYYRGAHPGYDRANVHFEGQSTPFGQIPGLGGTGGTSTDASVLVPRYGKLVLFSKARDELLIHPFDLDQLLARSETDYLAVTSEAPRRVTAGQPFEYSPVVRSKKGGVKLKLDAAPDGMKLTNGKLTWTVPADQAGQELSVILTVSDTSGQELFHSFRFTVVPPAKP